MQILDGLILHFILYLIKLYFLKIRIREQAVRRP